MIAFLTTRPPCTVIWQQPLQSVLSLRSCSATDLYIIYGWTVCRYGKEGWEEGRVKNTEFAVKDLPLSRTLWLIDIDIAYTVYFIRGKSFTANSGTKAAVLPKGRSCIANSGTKVAVSLGMNRCGSFPLHSADMIFVIRVFCPRTDLSLQTQAPRLKFCPKADLSQQTQEPRLQFYKGLNRCGSFPLFYR